MVKQQHNLYEFDRFRLYPNEHLLTKDGQPVSLTPRAFGVLNVLIRRGGHLVTKEELMTTVWGDAVVEDGNLVVTISMLRKALGEDGHQRRYIQTVSKQGYRFVGEIREAAVLEAPILTEAPPLHSEREEVPRRAWLSLQRAILVAGLLILVAISIGVAVPDKSHSGGSSIRSIAVLPFGNLSGDPQNDYMGLGIADAVITALGSTGQVIIRPTTAVLKYNRENANPLSVGREQGVDAVLDGNLRASAGKIQITVRLLRVADGNTLWVGTF